MASTRPRRNLPATSYKGMLNSDEEDSESTVSDSDLSEDSNEGYSTSPDQRTSNSIQVVRLPTATDILETQELIRTTAARLAIVNTEYKEAKRKFEAVQAKRDAMERELLERRAYLSRVRALPQEVLGLIFIFYTDDLIQSPWVLMQVTRSWRAAALSTRAIWARIMITSPAWKKSGDSRRKEGREVCGSKEQLDKALRRAGNAALDIVFALMNPFRGRWTRKYDRKAISEMLDFLSSSRKCLQVRHLEIKGPYANMFGNFWYPLQFPPSLEFPELRTICIKSPTRADYMTRLLRTSKQITEAELMLPSELPFGIEDLLQCPAMVTLTLDGQLAYLGGIKEHLRSALDNTPSLTTLHLNSFSSNDSVLRLPGLHTLVLSTGSEIWPLDASNLTNLTLSDGSYIRLGAAGSNHFPLLTSLTINASTSPATPPDYLNNLHFPPLHTLDVCFGRQRQELADLLSRPADLNPVVFRLRRTVVSTVYLTEVLESMGRLEELHLEDVPLKKDFFDFLASRAGPDPLLSGEIQLHCPLLVRLQVDLKSASPAVNKSIKPAAKKAIQTRVEAGVAMEKWSIRFSEDKGWLDLLA